MTQKKETLLLYSLLILEFIILFNSNEVINSVIESTRIFVFSVFPSLFPTMVLGLLITKLNLYTIIPTYIKKLFNILFNFNEAHINIFLSSMICGSPSSAIFIKEYLANGLISKNEAKYLMKCTIFINPLFVVGTIGIKVFNSRNIGVLLLILTYITNMIKAFYFRKNFKSHFMKKNTVKEPVINIFIATIKKSMLALLNILGFIIIFNLLITLITYIFNPNIYITTFINIFLEITSGIIKISGLNINIFIKIFISYISLSFGGICILMQAKSVLSNDN